MIAEDQDITNVNNNSTRNLTSEYLRYMPSISTTHTNPKALALKAEFENQISALATPQDDPVYLVLHAKYNGTVFYDNETRASQKLFRVRAVQFVQSYTSGRLSCWEATCEPIYRDSTTGKYLVPHALMVEGSSVIQTNSLLGYALAEYANGVDGDPTYLPWLDNYIDHFHTIILPAYARKMKPDLPSEASATKSPTTHPRGSAKDLPSTSKKDLPSKPKTSRTPKTSPPMDLPSKPKTSRTPCRPRKRFRSS